MLTEYIGKYFKNDRGVFKVLDTDHLVTTFLICPFHPSFSSCNYRYIEEVIDTYTYTTAEGLSKIERAREIEKEEFEEVVNNFVKELLNMI